MRNRVRDEGTFRMPEGVFIWRRGPTEGIDQDYLKRFAQQAGIDFDPSVGRSEEHVRCRAHTLTFKGPSASKSDPIPPWLKIDYSTPAATAVQTQQQTQYQAVGVPSIRRLRGCQSVEVQRSRLVLHRPVVTLLLATAHRLWTVSVQLVARP